MRTFAMAAAFVLAAVVCSAQVGLDVTGSFADWHITYGNISHPLPQGWESRFIPVSQGMHPKTKRLYLQMDLLEVGVAPTLQVGAGNLFRFPITYTPFRGFSQGHERVHETIIKWWDPVHGNDVDMRQMLPTFGIQYLKNGQGVGYSLTRYRFTKREYEGDDCVNCVNSSHVILEEPFGSAWGHRLSFVTYKKLEKDSPLSSDPPQRVRHGAEIYAEYQGKGVYRFGIKLIGGIAF